MNGLLGKISFILPALLLAFISSGALAGDAGEKAQTKTGIGSYPGTAPKAGGPYTHPKLGYSLYLPKGVDVSQKGGTDDILIRSRKGYLISVQAGPTAPSIPLRGMTAKLERRYLGTGKIWARKLAEKETTVAGLPANGSLYEGGGSRARVVIVRGGNKDYVFIFFAPLTAFIELEREFEQVLLGFRPQSWGKRKTNTTAIVKKDPKKASNLFSSPELGYSIQYPGDWIYEKSTPYTLVFSGREGTDAYMATVSVQNVQAPAGTTGRIASEILGNLKAQLAKGATEVAYFGEGPISLNETGGKGLEFLVSYKKNGQGFRQWSVVAPRPSGAVAHIWTYSAPVDRFELYRKTAETMFRSWKIQGE